MNLVFCDIRFAICIISRAVLVGISPCLCFVHAALSYRLIEKFELERVKKTSDRLDRFSDTRRFSRKGLRASSLVQDHQWYIPLLEVVFRTVPWKI
jgi:hypothetical protein